MILETKKLNIGYKGRELIKDLNLSLKKGEITTLIGKNGVGKSTLLRTLLNETLKLSGDVFVHGKNLEQYSAVDKSKIFSLVMSSQVSSLNLTVYDVVSMGRIPYLNWLGKMSKEDKKEVNNSIVLLGLESMKHRFINELSDGERQKVMIAKALCQNTEILILDEPTAYLDLSNRIAFFRLIKKLAQEFNKVILLSTHELEMAMQFSDQVWLINQQKVSGSTSKELITKGLLQKVFDLKSINYDENTGGISIRYF